jgi:hypothetical protein
MTFLGARFRPQRNSPEKIGVAPTRSRADGPSTTSNLGATSFIENKKEIIGIVIIQQNLWSGGGI